MAKLDDLTIPLLNKLAREYDIKFESGDRKSDRIAKIRSSIPKSELQDLILKFLTLKNAKNRSKKEIISELKGRIKLLEEQVKYLMSQVRVSDVEITTENNRDLIKITSDLSDIKRFIKSFINPGESITIDELIEIKEIKKIPLVSLKHALYDLIDDDIFELVEGNSRQKLFGKIGIIRRK